MKLVLPAILLTALACVPVKAADVIKTYDYFTIRGSTYEQIQSQLDKHGPVLKSTGSRHPGATRMTFKTYIGYAESAGSCRIVTAKVVLRVTVILPRWKRPRNAPADLRLFWDTLSADIKRHEDRHVEIARNYAGKLEKALTSTYGYDNCDEAGQDAKRITARVFAERDRAQIEFDRVELVNFESRIVRLLRYRLKQMADGRIPTYPGM